MARARDLAARGRYTAAPNPLVGAVVVGDGRILGEGWHVRPGEDHAEAMALKAAGTAARGATLYVTLEPCNRHRLTPGASCTELILRSGVRRVVVGHVDPNPQMRGRSVELLREAGVEVEVLNAPEFARQNEQFFGAMRTRRPFVHLKLAASLDGRIASQAGNREWLTGWPARRRVHGMRAAAGAVLVGAGTVRADDPHLGPRGIPGAPPVLRAVLDPALTTSPESRLARTAGESPVVVFSRPEADPGRRVALERAGVRVVPVAEKGGALDLRSVLLELWDRGCRGLLVEGGGRTAARFLGAGLVDKITLFYAPRLLGAEGVPMIGGLGLMSVAEAPGFRLHSVQTIGEDVMLTLYPREGDVHGDS
ncbi:bifunctional diaminohydroxyphosphoribosylaminopyrimidine deaminase/5-amino-6-(5-phosphoribosylamino)uracil reductase RibD [Rubrobacter taiwanensis]|jgi:diaminohydroxyphosphoribosylaminopyrimidine deaminase/5-amino-6-(5-phosphoribosylamino)uracil reductase|uniref:Riboflavin biosynthesis protein RibD n=1 Tax=Rubrobacter taiwanensis TaxID=185139 RepID=A0A4R1BHE9_9ACTN|nr:bifunctional diaminohydroxyphosphoribosylaminopyrimidine deaminase/5-amino-6-(5-phosphoribosylamino)uracil reductase RibD [Rubrobacter taiwanensis]TCJ16670.1 bifunctional diaminohydroxyphosphoribosylaminopyrimidine deaminase/5-amino-6-(5-phosphoribosylamino)uracil reductase RibD [Rubrobacter taiwanensis]